MVNNYALHNVETMRFWCQKVLPLVYDDSLSYYETLCKVITKLNEVINNENGQNEAITALDEQVGALATAQSEQYTELSNAIADEIARAVEAEGGLQEGLTALENYVNTQLDFKEDVANKTTVLANTSTIQQYPTAKTVYDALQGKVDKAQSASDNGKVLGIVGGQVTPVTLAGDNTVFIGSSATYAEVIGMLDPVNASDRKQVVYIDSADLALIATSWTNAVDGDIFFGGVVGDTLYYRVLNATTGWGALSYIVVGAGGTAWGDITGTLSNQTDLQNALNGKLSLTGGTMTGAIEAPNGTVIKDSANRSVLSQTITYTTLGTTEKRLNFVGSATDIEHNRQGTTYNVLDGYNTQANPTLAGTEADLTALKLNGTSYKIPSGSGSVAWGSITGAIANQSDLTTALSDCVQKSQGSANAGKVMTVNSNGVVEAADAPTELFWCTYGTTTYAQITAAINANKLPCCFYSSVMYIYLRTANNYHNFICCTENGYIYHIYVSNSNVWGYEYYQTENISNKVTSISSSSNNTQYPSAKCVYDNLVTKVDVAQGVAHAGEFLVVGSDGNVTTVTMQQWTGGNY